MNHGLLDSTLGLVEVAAWTVFVTALCFCIIKEADPQPRNAKSAKSSQRLLAFTISASVIRLIIGDRHSTKASKIPELDAQAQQVNYFRQVRCSPPIAFR